jgi:hypothetical protein
MARSRRVLGVVLSIAVLAACSGEPRLTRANFQQRANDECGTLQKASEQFAKAQAPGAQGEDVARYMHSGADELRRLVDRLAGLAPPEEMEEDVDALLEVLGDYADGLDRLADRVGAEQTFQDVLQESPAIVRKLNRLAERATNLVAVLGLVGCVLPA